MTASVPELAKRICSTDRHALDQQPGQPELLLGRLGEGRAPLELLDDGGVDGRVGVAVDQRGHVVEEVEPLDALDVGEQAARAGAGVDRVRLK